MPQWESWSPGWVSSSRRRTALLNVSLLVASAQPVERVEIISGGQVVHTFAGAGQHRLELAAELPAKPGWYLAQVISTGRERLPLALTNPVFVERAEP